MGLCLIGMIQLSTLVVIIEVALVLGLVIFVHELGHFVVAKLCGVKCEKFYLGFDIYGLKLCKFRWGETEYGVGILPLGGYVKMLGQEDNPSRLREEIERAKQQEPAEGDQNAVAQPAGDKPAADRPSAAEVAEAQAALYDPRSYLAKSVPKRMAIISAGVIMNVIFAYLAAVIGLRIGVNDDAAAFGHVNPGGPAWCAGFEAGDQIVEISGHKAQRFADLMNYISLGDNLKEGVEIVIKRPGQEELITKRVMPDLGGLKPTIGVTSAVKPELSETMPAFPGSVAAKADPPFAPGDQIVAIDGDKIDGAASLSKSLVRRVDSPIEVTVQRQVKGKEETLTTKVAANPMRILGLRMRMGEIAKVQKDSPAEAADIRPGDILRKIDGEAMGNPMTLPDRLRKHPGDTVVLSIEREGQQSLIEKEVKLRRVDRDEPPFLEGSPVSLPQLGLAYYVLNRVEGTIDGTPAAKAGLNDGDVITKAEILPPKSQAEGEKQSEIVLSFGEKQRNWPLLSYLLQQVLPDSTVKLTLERGGEPVVLEIVDAADWNNPDRGFVLQGAKVLRRAESWSEAASMGLTETKEALLMVVNVLRKTSGGQVSMRNFGGPLSILGAAAHYAKKGVSDLLLFVTMLSANLAVLNFLPIPVLDGGHMVFLAWEGIRGKPADERVQLVLTYIGLALILALMIFVMALDLNFISRVVPPK